MKTIKREQALMIRLDKEIEIPKDDFVDRLRARVKEGDTRPLGGLFDVFVRGRKKYIGSVDDNGFVLKMRTKLLGSNTTFHVAVAKGAMVQRGTALLVNVTIQGLSGLMKVYLLVSSMITLILLIWFCLAMARAGVPDPEVILVSVGVVVAMYGLGYMLMSESMTMLKRSLERDLHEIAHEQSEGRVK